MAKKFVDINDVIKTEDMPEELFEYEDLMRKKPNFDKSNDTSKKIYENGEFIILEVHSGKKKGYILYNTKKQFEQGHTHLHGFSISKTILSNVKYRKIPKTHDLYLLKSHIRVSDDDNYIRKIEQLIEVRTNKTKVNYRNVNSKKIKR